MIETSESTKALMSALLAFQGKVRAVKKDAKNPHFKNTYATLENVLTAAKPVLNENGIVVSQFPGSINELNMMEVCTQLYHAESGEWIRNTMTMPLMKRDAQGAGSAMTYAFRYSLMSLLGLPPTDDDDATEAVKPEPAVENSPPPKSSAALKRSDENGDDEWSRMIKELYVDFADCKSLVTLSKLRAEYREKAKERRWNRAFLEALANEFDTFEESLKANKSMEKWAEVNDDTFPGDLPDGVKNMMAG